MKIYTKTGDKGETSLVGGRRVPKYDIRIEAYGTVDELIAFTALLRDEITSQPDKDSLLAVLDVLMGVSAILASDCDDCGYKLPVIRNESITFLETEIDKMDAVLPQLQSFVIPGGHKIVSLAHVARTVCRRAERITLKLADESKVPENAIIYLNRLSDYFFTLSRKLTIDYQSVETPWIPKLEL